MTEPVLSAPLLFPADPGPGATALVLAPAGAGLPWLTWLGSFEPELSADDTAALLGGRATLPLLLEHSRGSYRRPGLRGHRLGEGGRTGLDWSTSFVLRGLDCAPRRLVIDADDPAADLALRTEVEALTGGTLRIRHAVTNTGTEPYVVEALEVAVPLPDGSTEVLDFTGRHEHERSPQRHTIGDGTWLRENRHGRTGLGSASTLVAGPPGFAFEHGVVVGLHVASSGNSVYWIERDPKESASIGGGELLLPGEMVLVPGDTYTTPWVLITAGDGLDALAASLHTWQRSLPAHPGPQPVVLNVWEAVYFDHDLTRLSALAERAARVGVERFVLDDGWFAGRRNDRAGLGDWWVDQAVWPDGLHPLIDRVRSLGMQFGLWFEPEMVNPDSDLYRAHPDWILCAGGRVPRLARHQLVLDLTNSEVWTYLLERLDVLLGEYDLDYVKWDHNRDLLEAGSSVDGAPVAHRQALAHYALLDELRRRHPHVQWESCASGGGRIDLGVLERVQRVWTSDMTDALARAHIQRWTAQLVAPEYLGAHVSAPTSHQTGRTLSLDFRAATALFGSFGLEWDLTAATEDDLDRLAAWVRRYQQHRGLLHSGRVVRLTSSDPAVLLHGVVAADGRSAIMAHVQLDESASNRGVQLRVPHLDPDARFRVSWLGPVDEHRVSRAPQLDASGPTAGATISGAALRTIGVWLPRRRPETMLLMHVEAI